jgi:hypothetical protein
VQQWGAVDVAAQQQRADADRAAELVPGLVSAAAPLAAKSTGICPTACTASVWNGMTGGRRQGSEPATGGTVPTSLLAHWTLTTAISAPYWSMTSDSEAGSTRPVRVDGQPGDPAAPLVGAEPLHRGP